MPEATPAKGPPPPLTGVSRGIASIALALGTFMMVLDSTIANVAVPTVAGNLGVSTSQGTWIITSFAVANGASVPLTGWLMGRYGVVRTFVASVTMFTVASVLCGMAWNMSTLILFRVLQGAVSGPMIPGSQALLIMIFPPNKRATALAIWSMTTLVAPICGPILGGYISDNYSWRWIFLINGPIGIASALICWRYLRARETSTRKLPVDRIGFALLLLWVGALQVMLDTGKDADWFNSPMIVIEALIAVVGFIAWLIWELNEEYPIVDLSLFRRRNFTLATIAFCLGFAIFFGNNLLLPLWLQTRMGYVATWAGLVAAPAGVVAVFASPITARVMNRIDARWTATISFIAFAGSYFLRSGYTPDASFRDLVIPMLVQGVALATFFVSMVTLSLNGIPPERIPQATGISNFTRMTAGSFAASLATTIWERSADMHQTRLAETIGATDTPFTLTLHKLEAAGMTAQQALAAVTQQVVNQSYFLAALDFFRASGWIMVVMIPLVWFSNRAVGGGGGPAGGD